MIHVFLLSRGIALEALISTKWKPAQNKTWLLYERQAFYIYLTSPPKGDDQIIISTDQKTFN